MFENTSIQTFVQELIHEARVVSKLNLQDQDLTLKLMSIRLRAANWLSNLSKDDRGSALELVKQAIEGWQSNPLFFSENEYETKCIIRLLRIVYKPPQLL